MAIQLFILIELHINWKKKNRMVYGHHLSVGGHLITSEFVQVQKLKRFPISTIPFFHAKQDGLKVKGCKWVDIPLCPPVHRPGMGPFSHKLDDKIFDGHGCSKSDIGSVGLQFSRGFVHGFPTDWNREWPSRRTIKKYRM